MYTKFEYQIPNLIGTSNLIGREGDMFCLLNMVLIGRYDNPESGWTGLKLSSPNPKNATITLKNIYHILHITLKT